MAHRHDRAHARRQPLQHFLQQVPVTLKELAYTQFEPPSYDGLPPGYIMDQPPGATSANGPRILNCVALCSLDHGELTGSDL